jgi:hypothetical protein
VNAGKICGGVNAEAILISCGATFALRAIFEENIGLDAK